LPQKWIVIINNPNCLAFTHFIARQNPKTHGALIVARKLQEFRSQPGHLSSNRATLFSKTVLANMSSILQILPHPKFEINRTSGSKVIAQSKLSVNKKLAFCP